MGDNYCDSVNNRAFCNYDGGDCCQSTVKTKKVSGIHVPGNKTPPPSLGLVPLISGTYGTLGKNPTSCICFSHFTLLLCIQWRLHNLISLILVKILFSVYCNESQCSAESYSISPFGRSLNNFFLPLSCVYW